MKNNSEIEIMINIIDHQMKTTLLGSMVANYITSGSNENHEKIVDFFIHKGTSKNKDALEVYYLLKNKDDDVDEKIILSSSSDEFVTENLLLKLATMIAEKVFASSPDNKSALRNFLSEQSILNIEEIEELMEQVKEELSIQKVMNHLKNRYSENYLNKLNKYIADNDDYFFS